MKGGSYQPPCPGWYNKKWKTILPFSVIPAYNLPRNNSHWNN